MDNDIKIAIDLIARAIYSRMAAAQAGSAAEHDTVYFSKDIGKRSRQLGRLWSDSAASLAEHGIIYEPATVSAEITLPYRRRRFAVCENGRLYRFAEVLDRIRVGLFDALVSEELESAFESDEGREAALGLLSAMTSYDFVKIAQLADEYDAVKEGLKDLLAVTDAELTCMRGLSGDDWFSLEEGEDYFGRFRFERRSA